MYILIEAEDLNDLIKETNFAPEEVTIVSSKGLTGETMLDAALIAIVGTGIRAAAKVISAYLSKDKQIKIVCSGKDITAEFTNCNEDEATRVLERIKAKNDY